MRDSSSPPSEGATPAPAAPAAPVAPASIPGRLGRALALAIGVIVLFHFAGLVFRLGFGHDHVRGFVPLVDLNGEFNVPAVFSTLLFFAASGLLGLIAAGARRRGESWWVWAGLAAAFAFLGVDELLQFHERMNRLRLPGFTSPFLAFPWVVWYGLFAGALGLALIPFLRRLPGRTRVRCLGAAALYLGGALGFEMLGAAEYARHGLTDWHYAALYTLEETFEMAGLALFIHALVIHALVRYRRPGRGEGPGEEEEPGDPRPQVPAAPGRERRSRSRTESSRLRA